jgi:hypothetical protein
MLPRVSAAQIEKDFFMTEVFPTFAEPYPPDQALRSELLIEISARSPILAPMVCGYDTIVNEILGRAERTGVIACLDIRETIAGKNAALLRRRGSAGPTGCLNLATFATKTSSDIFTISGEFSRSFHKS